MANSNEYMRTYMHNRYHARRAAAISKLGGKCVDCGPLDDLEFDHVDRETKKFNISKQTLSDEAFWTEIDKCVLRCDPCHNARSKDQMSVGHGEGKTGKRKCRCELCGPLKNKWARENRKSRAVSSVGRAFLS